MKPQERLLNYALLSSANCSPSGVTTAAASLGNGVVGQELFKEDIPIDLSVRKQAVVLEAHHSIAAAVVQHQKLQLQHHPQFRGPHSPPSEWIATKYGLSPNLTIPLAKPFVQHHQQHLQHYPPPGLLPYLFINPNCFTELEAKKAREELIYEQCATNLRGYSRLPPGAEGVLYPYQLYARSHEAAFPAALLSNSHQSPAYGLAPQHQLMHESSTSDGEKLPPSTGSSSACSTSSSSPSNNVEYHYYPECIPETTSRKSANHVIESFKVNYNTTTTSNGSHHTSNIFSSNTYTTGRIVKSKRSYSLSNLNNVNKADAALTKSRRSNSENNLHLITSFESVAISMTTSSSAAKMSAPKKMFVSNYYQNKFKEEMRENLLIPTGERVETSTKEIDTLNDNEKGTKRLIEENNKRTKSYRNYRKEAIESWGIENRDKQNRSSDENALDLRTNTTTVVNNCKENCEKLNDLNNLQNIESSTKAEEVTTTNTNSPSPVHVDLYRQYYYYLLQDPAFTSKAAMSAVAEAYAKIMSSNMSQEVENYTTPSAGDNLPLSDKHPNMYVDSKRVSPDFILNGSKAVELCSADTTITFDRKRISRPLTGKHVRHGTGASPATLVSLRNMIQQRQKFRESGKFELNGRFGKANKINNKRIKRK